MIERCVDAVVRHLDALENRRVRPARAEIERLIEWSLPVAEELGVASFLTVPAVSVSERQMARYEAGETLAEIYEQEVLEPVHV